MINSIKNYSLAIISFYALFLLQTSLFSHFGFHGYIPNLILLALIFLNLLENPRSYLGLFSAAFSGFFLDMFYSTSYFIGFYLSIYLLISISIKYFLKKYVQIF